MSFHHVLYYFKHHLCCSKFSNKSVAPMSGVMGGMFDVITALSCHSPVLPCISRCNVYIYNIYLHDRFVCDMKYDLQWIDIFLIPIFRFLIMDPTYVFVALFESATLCNTFDTENPTICRHGCREV